MEGTEESAEAGRACGAEGQREAAVEERLQWFGVAGALGQAVASGDGAGEGWRATRRAGCQPPDGMADGWAVSREGSGCASVELLGLL